jgi:hypothetical protein
MSHQYYTCKEKKENIVGDPLQLDYGHRPQPKEFC